jgi:hypothetical protein
MDNYHTLDFVIQCYKTTIKLFRLIKRAQFEVTVANVVSVDVSSQCLQSLSSCPYPAQNRFLSFDKYL